MNFQYILLYNSKFGKQLSVSSENAALVRNSTNASVISMHAQAGQLPHLWEQAAQQAAVVEREGQADPAAQSQEGDKKLRLKCRLKPRKRRRS